jgi:phosphoribosyl 1,2-cyclic phosphodiesterase
MMKLQVLSSSSYGNCYLFYNRSETLIVEAGVKFSEVQKALNYDLSTVVGCLVSHEHLDHMGRVEEFLQAAIPVYCSRGSVDRFNFKGLRRPEVCSHEKAFCLGNFKVLPFEIEHDATEPLGYLISHPETGKILFLTDTYYSEYTFKNLSHILVEANFADHILEENIASGRVEPFRKKRLLQSHMSLETCKDMLSANDLSQVINIVLLHLSSQNADPDYFKSEIEKHTGKIVNIATKGLTININKEGF